MENVVCCVCDAVGLSKPRGDGTSGDGECELVFRKFVYLDSFAALRGRRARVSARATA